MHLVPRLRLKVQDKGGGKSQYPIFGSTTGRIAALLLACVARLATLRSERLALHPASAPKNGISAIFASLKALLLLLALNAICKKSQGCEGNLAHHRQPVGVHLSRQSLGGAVGKT